jgi:serine/threonine protein kinase
MLDYTKDMNSQLTFLPYNSKLEVSRSSFEIEGHLGSGNFGSVYKGVFKGSPENDTRTTVAVKSLKGLAGKEQVQSFLYEIKIMGYLIPPHMNLLNIVGCCTRNLEEQEDLWLLVEFCEHGDLKNYLMQNMRNILSGKTEDPINSRCLLLWSFHIAKGMKYLSDMRIMHGDLAARNVLLRNDPLQKGNLVAKVSDFGLAKSFYSGETYQKEARLEIPWKWTALEYLEKNFYTLKSDVWSFMVLFWEILSFGGIPYGRSDYDEVLDDLNNGRRLTFPKGLEDVTTWSPEKLYNKLSGICFAAEPEDRGSFEDVLNVLEKEMRLEEKDLYDEQNRMHNLKTTQGDFAR